MNRVFEITNKLKQKQIYPGKTIETKFGKLNIIRWYQKGGRFFFESTFEEPDRASNSCIFRMMNVNKFTGAWNIGFNLSKMSNDLIIKRIENMIEDAITGQNN